MRKRDDIRLKATTAITSKNGMTPQCKNTFSSQSRGEDRCAEPGLFSGSFELILNYPGRLGGLEKMLQHGCFGEPAAIDFRCYSTGAHDVGAVRHVQNFR